MAEQQSSAKKRTGAFQKHNGENGENWKLVVTGELGPGDVKELFNLTEDPNETTNLAGEYPDILDEMFAEFEVRFKKQNINFRKVIH